MKFTVCQLSLASDELFSLYLALKFPWFLFPHYLLPSTFLGPPVYQGGSSAGGGAKGDSSTAATRGHSQE